MKYNRLIYRFNRYYHLEVTFNIKFKVVFVLTILIIIESFNYVIFKKKKIFKFKFFFTKTNKKI